ncbi:MAG: adenosine deaminase [Armatimonadetes bacterium]|nr:adenosine deaminase [Armatimonadota bacterium]
MSGGEFLRALPKIELHVHLETSLRLRRLLSDRDDPDPLEPHLVADPSRFAGYDRLRRLRYAGRAGKIPDRLYTPDNIRAITASLLAELAAQNVRYAEVRVGGRRAFSLLGVHGVLEAMAAGMAEAERAHGIRSGIIVTVVRERGPEEGERVVREALACRDCPVVGVDVAGDEANYPPPLFARVAALARDAGWGVTVHAGEFAGPASIWTAVYHLGAQRIGHGLRAVEDPALLDLLRDRGITLEVCPTSNLRLGLVPSLAHYPLRALMRHGVAVTINSDDPLLLGTTLTRELALVREVFRFSDGDLAGFMRAAARAAFSPARERARLGRHIDAALDAGRKARHGCF